MYDDISDPLLSVVLPLHHYSAHSALAVDQEGVVGARDCRGGRGVAGVVGKAKFWGPGSYLAVPYMIPHCPAQHLYFALPASPS